jgi:hypothetical protein
MEAFRINESVLWVVRSPVKFSSTKASCLPRALTVVSSLTRFSTHLNLVAPMIAVDFLEIVLHD